MCRKFLKLSPIEGGGGVATPEGDAGASPALEGVDDASPASGEEEVNAAGAKDGEDGQPKEDEEEVLPFGKHPRWQKLQAERKELAEKVKSYDALGVDTETLQKAVNLQKLLQSNPSKLYEMLGENLKKNQPELDNKSGKQDPSEIDAIEKSLDAYEPEAAAALKFLLNKVRQYDQLIEKGNQERQDWEAQTERQKAAQMEENQNSIDEAFDKLATDAGYLDKDGNGDEKFMMPFAKHIMAELTSIAKNPKMPTTAELKTTFDNVSSWMGLVEKKATGKKVVKVPPAGGGGNGRVPGGKVNKTEAEMEQARLNDLMGVFS